MILPKEVLQRIRYLSRRGTNEKLTEALETIYAAGIEKGMQMLSSELKGRLNDNQSTDNSDDNGRERGEPDSSELSGGGGASTTDADSDRGSPDAAPNN